ncbi:MAG TPA: hypothetical protein VM055_01920 [Novosphingobium sp.]|nr:hypothetical protein [Novosphingobium sp.]
MSALVVALVAALLAGIGAREQRLVTSGWTALAWLAVTGATCAASVALGAAGGELGNEPRLKLAAIALALAAVLMVWGSSRSPDPARWPVPRFAGWIAALASAQANGALPPTVAAAVLIRGGPLFALAGAMVGALLALALGSLLSEPVLRRARIGAAAWLGVAAAWAWMTA